MKWIKTVICIAFAFIILISTATAIVEHIKQETVERMNGSMPLQLNDENNPEGGQGYDASATAMQPITLPTSTMPAGPSGISYTIIPVGPREFLAAGWLNDDTQIIVLYHNMDESEAKTRANEWFTSIGETAASTGPSPTMLN
jgi:hypothetical protein